MQVELSQKSQKTAINLHLCAIAKDLPEAGCGGDERGDRPSSIWLKPLKKVFSNTQKHFDKKLSNLAPETIL